MIIRDLKNCEEIIGNDKTIIHEIMHPPHTGNTIRYSLTHAELTIGKKSLPHKLTTSEVYYILEGEGKMHIDENESLVVKNQAVFIPPNAIQWIENLGNSSLKFLCLVDPSWKPENDILV